MNRHKLFILALAIIITVTVPARANNPDWDITPSCTCGHLCGHLCTCGCMGETIIYPPINPNPRPPPPPVEPPPYYPTIPGISALLEAMYYQAQEHHTQLIEHANALRLAHLWSLGFSTIIMSLLIVLIIAVVWSR